MRPSPAPSRNLTFPVMARDRGGLDILMEPSRFIRELPGDSYEKVVIGSE